jgi:hypothetical protein
MAAALIPFAAEPQQSVLARGVTRAEAYARNSTAENTRRGYRSDWAGRSTSGRPRRKSPRAPCSAAST